MVPCSHYVQETPLDRSVPSQISIYERVTNKIIAMIGTGTDRFSAPWHVPGGATLPVNAATHAEYRGVNVLSLWIDAQERGYPSSTWASYQQWQKLGAQVRKKERGSLVVFYKRIETEPAEQEDHDTSHKLRFLARAAWVFNAAQVDGYVPDAPQPTSQFQRVSEVEAFVKAVNANIRHGFSVAQYRHDTDIIEMPKPEWFVDSKTSSAAESYYAILLHELTHWVGAPHRLNRTFGKRFGDKAYAFEELVAELGAAFMCAAFGISTEPRPDHAAYVSSWLEVLNRDPKAIFTAASKAQEAFEHLAYLATRNEMPSDA
jgi:antirestriction protein ArdC